MLEIIASVCLMAEPGKCKDVHLTFAAEAEAVTQSQCFMFGQIELAKWREGHPDWRIARWSCRAAREIANI